jgi:DNA-directed RNA polymerase subunit alpha
MVNLPKTPQIVKKEKNKAVFEIEALYPSYGVTIGNSLRRVLLSSLEGAAATQVKIKGISHEFSTIPGVLEDVVLIMLNLKKLRFKVFVDEPQKVTLKVKGEKTVKGSDFNLPSQVELLNKDCHIATLTTKSAELEMEILVEKGIGYSSLEARKEAGARSREKLEIGVIPLDATFTPVKRVSYRTENMRVGERTDYDRLFLEIETDGTITPEEAFYQASNILVNHFSLFTEAFKVEAVKKEKKKAPVQKKKTKKEQQAKTRYAKKKTRKKTK